MHGSCSGSYDDCISSIRVIKNLACLGPIQVRHPRLHARLISFGGSFSRAARSSSAGNSASEANRSAAICLLVELREEPLLFRRQQRRGPDAHLQLDDPILQACRVGCG